MKITAIKKLRDNSNKNESVSPGVLTKYIKFAKFRDTFNRQNILSFKNGFI